MGFDRENYHYHPAVAFIASVISVAGLVYLLSILF